MIIRPFNIADPWPITLPLPEGVEAMVAEVDCEPFIVFLVIAATLPEVHIDLRRGGMRHLREASRLMRDWVMQTHPQWRFVWTFVQSPRMERLAKRFGFVPACVARDGDIYLYHPMFGGRN